MMTSRVETITCFLCGGLHIYPGPRFETHLINEHGALFHTEFLIEVALYKGKHSCLPILQKPLEPGNDIGIQTCHEDLPHDDSRLENGPTRSNFSIKMYEDASAFMEAEIKKEPDDETSNIEIQHEISLADQDKAYDENEYKETPVVDSALEEKKIQVWICPVCPQYFKKMSFIKQHMCIAHEVQADDYIPISSVEMTEKELQERFQIETQKKTKKSTTKPTVAAHTMQCETRKPIGEEWEPNSFSSRFTCYFCGEQFRKDYKLKLHLMMKHKDQPADIMAVAKEELIKSKLDGCVHKCGLCGNKYNSIANFTRHIKDVHNITRSQYKVEYGDSEIISRMFTCELCQKEVKHTRNIIGAHMKMVHLISWKEYQDIVVKLKNGEDSVDLPSPEMFTCVICGVSVKYKREHLHKKHQIDEEVYAELVEKNDRGESIVDHLPERDIYTCSICDRECMDLKRHLQSCHKLTEEVYKQEFLMGGEPIKKILKQEVSQVTKPDAVLNSSYAKAVNISFEQTENTKIKSRDKVEGEVLSTDLQCYFNCQEVFKKDYQLYLHLKLKHRNEDPSELKKAHHAAGEEIALTRRTGSLFSCALCPRVFHDNGAFYGHIQNKHQMSYRDYKEKYGRCETESRPFECSICNKVIKHERNTIHTHLKMVHGINWTQYLDRIRKIRQGLTPDPLPALKTVECLVCNINVKYLREHLKNAHKISEQEYEDLFEDDSNYKRAKKRKLCESNQKNMSDLDNGLSSLITSELDFTVLRPASSEIKDRENKSCSVCEEDFPSRKEFIEHCQLIHGMRFKTKSGAPVPLPGTSEDEPQLQTQLDPEKSADVYGENRSFRTIDGFEIEIDGFLCKKEKDDGYSGEQCSTIQTKWNLCLYQCAVCSEVSNSRPKIMDHVLSDHDMDSRTYLNHYPDPEISKKWFLCRICNARVKFMKDPISVHLKNHGTDLGEYERSLMREEDWPYHPDHQSFNDSPTKNFESDITDASFDPNSNMSKKEESKATALPQWKCFICEGNTIQSQVSISSHLLESHNMTLDAYKASFGDPLRVGNVAETSMKMSFKADSDFWNKCRFNCPLCGKEAKEKKLLRRHANDVHNAELEELEQTHGDSETHTVYFRCELCSSEVKHIYKNISMHLQRSHNLTPAAYRAQFHVASCSSKSRIRRRVSQGAKGQVSSPFPCQHCGKGFSSRSNRSRHSQYFCNYTGKAAPTLKESNGCPLTGCDQLFQDSMQLKNHLSGCHKVYSNVSVTLRATDRLAAERGVPVENGESSFDADESLTVLEKVSDADVFPDSTTGEERGQILRNNGIQGELASCPATQDPACQDVESQDERSENPKKKTLTGVIVNECNQQK